MKKSKRFFAILMVLLSVAALFPTTLISAAEIPSFPLRTIMGDILVADRNTLVTTLIVQDPVTKLITATFQLQQGLDAVAADREKITITGISTMVSFSGKVAPYDPATSTVFSSPTLNIDTTELRKYAKALITNFDVFGTSLIQRDMSGGTGGFIGTMLSYVGSFRLEVEPGAPAVNIMELYFMPVGADQELSLDMFSFGYYYYTPSTSRATNRIGNGTTFMESDRSNVTSSNKYIISPSSFKLHLQRPKPNINAENFYSVYDPNTMEWSTSIDGPYSSTVPTLSDTQTIYVRAKGTEYSGSDATFVDYKKFVPSEAVAIILVPVQQNYTVTYKANGGTGNDVSVPVVGGEQYTIAANTFTPPTGQSFGGWNTAAAGTGTQYATGDSVTITGDLELYAKWNASACSVTYKANGGTGGDIVVPVFYNQQYEIAANTFTPPTGHSFDGWNTAAAGTGTQYAAGDSVTITGNLELYAKWKPNTYSVTYKANGGTGGDVTVPVLYNEQHTVAANTFGAPAGQSFVGWNTVAAGSGTPYAAGASVTITGDLVLYAQWSANPHKVTYKANGGTGNDVFVDIAYNQVHTVAANSFGAPTGQSFNVWNTEANGSGTSYAPGAQVTITGDLVLYAQWAPTDHKVTYNANGGIGQDRQVNVKYGDVHTVEANSFTAQTNYVFTGWNTVAGGSGTPYAVGATINIVGDVTLYAQWEFVPPDAIIVNLNPNGGTLTGATSITVYTGSAYGQLPGLTGAWSLSPPPGGQFYSYEFAGWFTTPLAGYTKIEEDTIVTLTTEHTLYARWYATGVNTFTVVFDGNSGVPELQLRIVEENGTLGADMPDEPTRVNYDFLEWNTAIDGSGSKFDETTPVTRNIRVYAKWNPRPTFYTVTFRGNNGLPEMQTCRVEEGTALEANMPEWPVRVGYVFTGWNTRQDGQGSAFTDKTIVNGNTTVYAMWTPEARTVTYKAGQGTGQDVVVDTVYDAHHITMGNTFTAPVGYSFNGWNTEADGGGTSYAPSVEIIVKSNVELYAQWKANQYKVTYKANGGAGQDVEVPVVYNQTYTIVANTFTAPAGHTFGGWNTAAAGNGTSYAVNAQITITDNVVLYARWTGNPHTVTYKANGGTNADVVDNVAYNAEYTIKSNSFTPPSGKVFDGWNTSESGSGTSYSAGSRITISGDVVLYAQWKDPGGGVVVTTRTVTFNGNGGTPETQTRSVASGGSVGAANMPANPTLTDYTFVEWNTMQNGSGSVFTATTTVTSNITVYAKWVRTIDDPEVPMGFTEEHIPYIQGYPDNSVKPDNNITRAEVAMIFFRLLSNSDKNNPQPTVFSDVASGAWYAQAVNYLASKGILEGYPDGTFKPNAPITRAEFATIALRFDELEPAEDDAFPDIEGHWAEDFINSAAKKGWVNGYEDGTFRPQAKITRAEVVVIVNRMLDRKIKLENIPEGIRQFVDLSAGYWAYTDIVEASNNHDYEREDDGFEIWSLK